MDDDEPTSEVTRFTDPGPKVQRVADVDEAIALAQKWQIEGRYEWFRGQVQCWPPYSSMYRLMQSDGEESASRVEARMSRFMQWMQQTPGLAAIAVDVDAVSAIAQHHGIPTDLIDFTIDPAVAGFFAADSRSAIEPGTIGCIYCLDPTNLLDFWELQQELWHNRDGLELPPLKCVRPEVPNLWRMHAQSGVFLQCAVGWDDAYPLDRIVFPYTGPPSFPTRDIVYPVRRSPLELLLDQFFDNEKKLEGAANLLRMIEELRAKGLNFGRTQASALPGFLVPECFRGGELPVHDSWATKADWLVLTEEHLEDVRHEQIQLALDLNAAPAALHKRARAGFEQALRRHPDARAHAIHWLITPTGPAHSSSFNDDVMKGLAQIWDGMRREPFTDAQLAQSLATWVCLGAAGYESADTGQSQEIGAELFGGPIVHLEFRAADGASSRGWASVRDLMAAVRPDIDAWWANDKWRERGRDPRSLLQMCYDPQRVFDFHRLLDVFVDQIGPTQLNRSEPYFFHPARLDILGLP